MKISFKNDYSEGAHPSILNRMLESNLEQQQGYGCDTYTNKAKALIAEKLNNPQSKIYFVSGGTQANLLALGAMLRPYESVITCETSHICDSETGAIEATGHKIHLTPAIDGKIQLDDIREVATCYTNFPHFQCYRIGLYLYASRIKRFVPPVSRTEPLTLYRWSAFSSRSQCFWQ